MNVLPVHIPTAPTRTSKAAAQGTPATFMVTAASASQTAVTAGPAAAAAQQANKAAIVTPAHAAHPVPMPTAPAPQQPSQSHTQPLELPDAARPVAPVADVAAAVSPVSFTAVERADPRIVHAASGQSAQAEAPEGEVTETSLDELPAIEPSGAPAPPTDATPPERTPVTPKADWNSEIASGNSTPPQSAHTASGAPSTEISAADRTAMAASAQAAPATSEYPDVARTQPPIPSETAAAAQPAMTRLNVRSTINGFDSAPAETDQALAATRRETRSTAPNDSAPPARPDPDAGPAQAVSESVRDPRQHAASRIDSAAEAARAEAAAYKTAPESAAPAPHSTAMPQDLRPVVANIAPPMGPLEAAVGPEATTVKSPAAEPAQPQARQVAVQITRAVREGTDRIQVQLKPATLGTISIELEVGHDNRIIAIIAAERAETLEILQRDARSLERALNEAGLKTDSGSLSFDLRGEGGQGDLRGGDTNGSARTFLLPEDAEANAEPVESVAFVRPPSGSGIDIRI